MRTSAKQKYGLITALIVVFSFVFYSAVFITHTQAATGTNQQLNYQGRLLDISGAVVADGLYNMEFKIYQDGNGCVGGGSAPCGGTLKWTETYIQANRVTVKNGYFSVNLGSLTAFGSSVDWNQDTLWLSINIGGTTNTPTPTWDGEMTQFKRLTSTPYALNSAQLGGLTAANFVQLAQGVQGDTSTSQPSIFINKTNVSGSPNILQLQKASADVFVVSNSGTVSIAPAGSSGSSLTAGTITLPADASIGSATKSALSIVSGAITEDTGGTGTFNGLLLASPGALTIGFTGGNINWNGLNITTPNATISNPVFNVVNNGLKISTGTIQGSGTSNGLDIAVGASIGANSFTTTNGISITGGALTSPGNTSTNAIKMTTAALALSSTATVGINGLNLATAGAISTSTAAGTINWNGAALTLPAATANFAGSNINANGLKITTGTLTQTAGTVNQNAIGLDLSSSSITTGGTLNGLNITPMATEPSVGTVRGINIGSITTGGNAGSSTALNIGSGWDSAITVANTSTTAFQIQNAGSTNILTADTTNARIAIDSTFSAMAVPSGLTSTASAGGSLVNGGSYRYEVTAIDSAGGETTVSNEPTACATSGANLSCTLNWTAVTGASGYKVYRTANGGGTGTEKYYVSVIANSYIDTGSIFLSSTNPPGTNNAKVSTNNSNSSLQLSVGGLGKATGQIYVSGSVPVDVSGGGVSTGNGPHCVHVQGRYAYVATFGSDKLQVFDISNPASPVDISGGGVSLAGSARTLYVQGRYAYVGSSTKLQVFDISNPASPVDVTGGGVTMIFSYSIYVQGRYLYSAGTASHKLQVFDVSNPASPVDISGGGVTTATSPQGIFVQGRYAYVIANSGNKLQIFDVSNPATPVDVSGGGVSTATGPRSIYVQGRYAYIAVQGGSNKLQVFDISNPASPVDISGGGVTTAASPQGIYVQGRYAYVTSATGDKLQVFDVSNPTTPVDVSGGGASTANAPRWVYVQGRYAYIISFSGNKLQVYDLGGAYTQQLEAGGAELGTLGVMGNASFASDASVVGGLNVGASINSGGLSVGYLGSTAFGANSVNGASISTGAITQTSASTGTYNGLSLSTPGAINTTTAAGTLNWNGAALTVANATANFAGSNINANGLKITTGTLTQTAGTLIENGLALDLSSSIITTGGTLRGLNITGSSSNAAGTQTAINIGGITPGAAAETGIAIGAGYDTGISVTTAAAETGLSIAASAAPTVDMVNITNAGFGATTAGVSGLQISYVGGAAAVESSGQRIDLTGGTSAGGTWNGLRITQGTITAGTTVQDIKLETAALTTTSGTTVINGLNLATAGAINSSTAGSITWSALNVSTPNVTQGAGGSASANGLRINLGSLTTGGSQTGLNITGSSSNVAGTLTGINIAGITPGAATETGLVIGSGWDNAIDASGNVLINERADSTAGSYTTTNSAAGTFGADTAITGATASAIYKGKLFVATSKTDAAGVYRYDGGTTWTLVVNAVGKVQSSDVANIDSFSLTVFNNQLVIGTKGGANVAGVYTSTNANTGTSGTTTWTLLNTTRGQFATGCLTVACPTTIDGVDDLAVYNGQLYIITQEANATEVYRYLGGTGASVFFRISGAQPGEILVADATDGDGGVLQVFGNRLYVGVKTGSTTGRVFYYSAAAADDLGWTLVNTTRGTFTTGTASEPDVVSMTVYNGTLWIATGRTNLANIYMLKAGFTGAGGASPFLKMTTTSGKIISSDTANIDSIILKGYQGRLYVGTSTGAGTNTGAVYEYDASLAAADNFNLIGSRGTFGSETNVDDVGIMQPMNVDGNGSLLYIGTNDSANTASVYSWFKFLSQSYGLRFDSGSGNMGSIMFTADDQSADNNARLGKFVLSHSVNLSTGAFDYAEDYPTLDNSLEPGEPVSVDPVSPEHVKRALPGETILGVVSENPGMTLSSTAQPETGAKWLPIALVGRVPVKVTTNEGKDPIKPGDNLTLSSVPGVLQKSKAVGQIVGTALAGYESDVVGKVSMYVNPGWNGNFSTLGATTTQTSAGINLLIGSTQSFNIQDFAGNVLASFDDQGNATFKGIITAEKIKANQIEGMEVITNKISSLQDKIDKTKAAAGGSAPPSKSNTLQVTDLTAVNLSVLADIEAKGGLTVEKDALFKGKTIFALLAEFNGPVKFNGQVSYNSDAGGTAVIKKDSKKVTIKFSKEYTGVPIITANYLFKGSDTEADQETLQRLLDGGYTFIVSQPSTKGFSIILNKPATEDIYFTWLANLINNPQLSQTGEPTTSSQ